MSGIAFVSKSANEKEKQRKREARLAVLEQAKRQYDVDAEKKERRKAQGVDTWLSSGFSARLDAEKRIHGMDSGSGDSDAGKKKKKSKKHKKEKHKKKKKEKKSHGGGDGSSSESESDGGADAWLPAQEASKATAPSAVPAEQQGASGQRDSWMVDPSGGDFFSSLGHRKGESEAERKRKEEEDEKKGMFDKPGQHPLELNKYWKDGGTGLPPEEEKARASKAPIGDGGKSWIRRAYQRAVEQADREGRSLAEVAAERWGSLEKLESMLAAAGGAPRGGDSRDRHRNDRYRNQDGHSRRRSPPRAGGARAFRRPNEGDDDRQRSSFRRPDEDDRGSRGFQRPQDGGRERFTSSRSDRDRHQDQNSESAAANHYRSSKRPDDGERLSCRSHSPSPSDRRSRRSPDRSRTVSSHRPDSSSNPGQDTKRSESSVKTTAAVTPSSSTTEAHSRSPSLAVPAPVPAAEEPKPAVSIEPVTEAQLNTLGAKIVKAELMGNKELAERLQKKLAILQDRKQQQQESNVATGQPAKSSTRQPSQRDRPQQQQQQQQHRAEEIEQDAEEVTLTRMDRSGNVRPAMAPDDETAEALRRRQRQKKVATHTDGNRERYFANDDKFSLSDLVARERTSTAEDMDSALHRMSGRFVEKTNDDDYTLDDMYVSRAARKQRDGKEEERDMRRAMAEHRKSTAAMERCHLCIDSTRFSQHLVIAMGMKVYLSVPDYAPLTDGHCILSTTDHSLSTVAIDEEVVSEFRVFQKGLVAMYKEQDEDVIFLETSYLQRRRHMFIECIPVPKEVGDVAPIYFKKAIMESEEEWSQNKKLIDTREKGLRRSIPKGFSYFSAEFGLDGGFAHAIEDDESFSPYFGKEIIGGILDADAQLWRKPRRLGPAEQKRKVMNFSKMWEPYDWTKRLQQ